MQTSHIVRLHLHNLHFKISYIMNPVIEVYLH